MGICASCLGGSHPRAAVEQEQDEVESGPLLFSVPNGMHYGSFAEPQMAPHSSSSDPSRAQRETEALQRVIDRTLDGLVDVYDDTTPVAYHRLKLSDGGMRDRKVQYEFVLTRVDSDDASLSTTDEEDVRVPFQGAVTHNEADLGRRLVGCFREAAAAMA